ncbi:MAG: YlxR family protein [Oscillospiraceae bacterium]|nr:YlxR family protein [Oscillospiraceae bacterium]
MAESLRMCAGCRARATKKELIRIVRTPDGQVIADAKAKAPGRGAYLCRKTACLEKARKSRALERMLAVEITPETYEALAAAIGDSADG